MSLASQVALLAQAVGTQLRTTRRRNAPALLRTGAVAETFDRRYISSNSLASGSTVLRCAAIQLMAGDVVSNLVFAIGTTAAVTPTHHFATLLDSAGNVLGVSADKTTTAIAANGEVTYALTAPVTIPASGVYYIGLSVTAGTPPTLLGGGLNSYAAALAPALNASVAQSLPPAVGAVVALAGSSGLVPWAWVS